MILQYSCTKCMEPAPDVAMRNYKLQTIQKAAQNPLLPGCLLLSAT